ncbi:P-loop containing nucleoside triphosphate hydrolase protein [Lanmaoa asiatica]|nr:P-loop containing nucleoside triphosphate hydrolase protein [Lanmaoa asiatica]
MRPTQCQPQRRHNYIPHCIPFYFDKMAMKMQTLILIALLDRPADIFADESQAEFWHLSESLFQEANPVLSDSELESINAMISAVQNARGGRAKQHVIESGQHSAGYAALLKWHAAYKFNSSIYLRVQKALEDEELSPHALIWSRRHKLEDFPPRSDADGAIDAVACAVFGENCLASERVVGEFKEAVAALIHHEWERQRKRYVRAVKTLINKKLMAQSAFADIEKKEEPTISEIRAAIRALRAYKDAIYWFPKEEDAEGGIHEMMGGLEAVLQTAIKTARKLPLNTPLVSEEAGTDPGTSGYQLIDISFPNLIPRAELRGKGRMAHVKHIAAAAAGDIEEIWATYVQLFGLKPASDVLLQSVLNSEAGAHEAWQDLADLGVAKFAQHSEEALSSLLNFQNGCPTLFAKLQSTSGLCAWNTDDANQFVPGNPDMKPLRLLWHQLVGVASIIDKVFSAEPVEAGLPGILIADAVGVGKTALTMGVIAFIIDAFYAQEAAAGRKVGGKLFHPSTLDADVRVAPIIGRATIDDLPHVIAVGNSLVRQWTTELQTFFAPGRVEIYIFPTAESKFAQFWEGDWKTSKTPFINRIILVPHSVMTSFGRAFDLRRHRGVLYKKLISADRKFSIAIIDEAHEFRNASANWYAALELMKSARLPLLLTATPLFTSPQDLCNLGRLLRIPQFCGRGGDERENEFVKKIRSARRGISRQDKVVSAEKAVATMVGGGDRPIQVVPDSIQRVRAAYREWIGSIRVCYGNNVIRRTVESKRYDGRMINDSLPPYKMVVGRLVLTEGELIVIRKVLDGFSSGDTLGTIEDGEGLNTVSTPILHRAASEILVQKFYLEGRTKAAFPFHESPVYPVVSTRAEYSAVRSTKADMLVALVCHHLSTDSLAPASFDHHPDLPCVVDASEQPILNQPWVPSPGVGEPPRPLWTPVEPDGGVQMPQLKAGSRKILIYHEFAMMAPLILSIFKVYGINAAAVNGTQNVEERDQIVVAFQKDAKCRVLLFSNVGAVGLNLTAATVIILFDQCWSRMLVNQIIGRAWRLGQTEEIVVYNMVCDQTVDCLMTDYAQGKGSMLEQFLATQHGKGWFKDDFKGWHPSTWMRTGIKKLLASGKPPIEELPLDGPAADSSGDPETELMMPRRKGTGKGKSSTKTGKGRGSVVETRSHNSQGDLASCEPAEPTTARTAEESDHRRESAIQGLLESTIAKTTDTNAETAEPPNHRGKSDAPRSPKFAVGESGLGLSPPKLADH